MAGKEAVVFVLDTNVTMNAPYPPQNRPDARGCSDHEPTRLSQAKEAVLGSIIDLMWRSKTHEAGLVVLKAGATHHHLSEIERIADDVDVGKFFRRCGGGAKLDRYEGADGGSDVFPNLVEFELKRPTPSTLRAMNDAQCTISESMASTVQGDFCDGLILAADALHRRTNGKKYKRKIVMITDAEHEVEVNGEQLQCVLDGLNKMGVILIVVGIGFEEDIGMEDAGSDSDDDIDAKPDAAVSGPAKEDSDVMIKEEGNPDEMMVGVKAETDMQQLVKRENEKLLLSIARETRGFIVAANGANLSDVLQTKLPLLAGNTSSTRKNAEFRIAPELTLVAKSSKLMEKKNLPSTIKEAYQFDPKTGEKLRDGTGELMTSPVKNVTYHYDDQDKEVTLDKRTDAFRYGCDLIPIGKMDMLGINAAFASPASIEMIGYLDKSLVESSFLLMGPAYAITGGGDSKKSRTAIAALSQGLEEAGRVGFCRFVKMKDGEPRIGALLPKLEGAVDDSIESDEQGGRGGRYLVFLELPFADDLKQNSIPMVPSEFLGDSNDERVCDELIDSMMLPDCEFLSEEIHFPALKSYQQMVAHFAMNPLNPEEELKAEGLAEERVLEASQAKPLSEFETVKALARKASGQIDTFVEAFTLVERKPEDDKKPKIWGDGINAS